MDEMTKSVRPKVMAFAQAMEERLAEHDSRPGWENAPYWFLLSRLIEEIGELAIAMRGATSMSVLREAADVANFCMMIADNSGELS
jgi:NTP pyrophosphatase (non-canonical NTP hydrolase)